MKTEIEKLIDNLDAKKEALKKRLERKEYNLHEHLEITGRLTQIREDILTLRNSLPAEQKAIEDSYDMAIFDVAEKMVDQSDKFLSGQEYFSTTYKK